MMSIVRWLGLPPEVHATLLIASILLALTPYFGGAAFGSVTVPRLPLRTRRSMVFGGPLLVALLIGLGIPIAALSPRAIELGLLIADATDDGEIDVVIRNSGTAPAILTSIELEIVGDRQAAARVPLAPTARYRIPLGTLPPGSRRAIAVRHLIAPSATEEIRIAPETPRALDLRVRIHSADGAVLDATVHLWPHLNDGAPTPAHNATDGARSGGSSLPSVVAVRSVECTSPRSSIKRMTA
jgi:hypothetical protein